MHLTPLRGPRSLAFCSVITCLLSHRSIGAAQVMPRPFGRRFHAPLCNNVPARFADWLLWPLHHEAERGEKVSRGL
jgi:hypothetical protein